MYFQRPHACCSYYEKEVVVNNFTRINKTNNYPLLQIIEHKKTTKYADGTGLCFGQAQKMMAM